MANPVRKMHENSVQKLSFCRKSAEIHQQEALNLKRFNKILYRTGCFRVKFCTVSVENHCQDKEFCTVSILFRKKRVCSENRVRFQDSFSKKVAKIPGKFLDCY